MRTRNFPFGGTAQVGPINIRSQVFAGHCPGRRPFDRRAALSGNWPDSRNPLIHCRWRHAEHYREGALTPEVFAGDFDSGHNL